MYEFRNAIDTAGNALAWWSEGIMIDEGQEGRSLSGDKF